jgi:DNA repair ATPase RecN
MINPYAIIGGAAYVIASVGLIVFYRHEAELWKVKHSECDAQRGLLQDSADDLAYEIEELNTLARQRQEETDLMRSRAKVLESMNTAIQQDYDERITEILSRRPTSTAELEICEEGRLLGVRP